eukprot:12797392-Alexandrium_andersonii.AAC.1
MRTAKHDAPRLRREVCTTLAEQTDVMTTRHRRTGCRRALEWTRACNKPGPADEPGPAVLHGCPEVRSKYATWMRMLATDRRRTRSSRGSRGNTGACPEGCLLYTSDAADDM